MRQRKFTSSKRRFLSRRRRRCVNSLISLSEASPGQKTGLNRKNIGERSEPSGGLLWRGKWRPPFPLPKVIHGSLRSPILFSPTPIFFPYTPNSGACCQASKLSFVGFSVLICQSISKTTCRIIVFDCRRCRHNINRQSFCHRLCFDRELDFVIYECSIPRFKGCKRYERSEVF